MCIFAGEVIVTATRVCLYDAEIAGVRRHVLSYENQVESQISSPNMMLLHIDAEEPLRQEHFFNTESYKEFMGDLSRTAFPPGRSRPEPAGSVEHFKVGNFDVFVSRSPALIPAALEEKLPPEKCPTLQDSLLHWYQKHLPNHQFVLAVFNSTETEKAPPIMLHYQPRKPDLLQWPALDSHDGSPPNLSGIVERDHELFFGTDRDLDFGRDVRYLEEIPAEVQPFMPKRVWGTKIHAPTQNGDFIASIEDLLAGKGVNALHVGVIE